MKGILAAYQLDGPTLSLGNSHGGDELPSDSIIASILEKSDYKFELLDDLERMRALLLASTNETF